MKTTFLWDSRTEEARETGPWKALRESFRRRRHKSENGGSNAKNGSNGARHQRGSQKVSSLRELAAATEEDLWKIKLAHRSTTFWYPYPILRNVAVLERLAAMANFDLLELCRGQYGKIADIGAADGDLAFFLEKQGLLVDVIDNAPTNFNRLEGARVLKDALDSSVTIRTIDLDAQFPLSAEKYDAIFFLGTLYHLKNPFLILERLARMTEYCFISTRVARQTPDGQPLSPHPVAYLLGSDECNHDNTNYWIFSEEGLTRLIDRTGWNVLSYVRIGDTTHSTPGDPDRDERAFCLLQSRAIPTLKASPNPVPVGEEIGETTITWNTGDEGEGMVYVSEDGREETFFATARQDSRLANWIHTGSRYEFRLYNSDHTRRLAQVVVTRPTDAAPSLTASPNPVPAGKEAGRTMISWNAANEGEGKIYVSENGADELFFAMSRQNSQVADWIEPGSSYEFRLYNSDRSKLLDKVVVTMASNGADETKLQSADESSVEPNSSQEKKATKVIKF